MRYLLHPPVRKWCQLYAHSINTHNAQCCNRTKLKLRRKVTVQKKVKAEFLSKPWTLSGLSKLMKKTSQQTQLKGVAADYESRVSELSQANSQEHTKQPVQLHGELRQQSQLYTNSFFQEKSKTEVLWEESPTFDNKIYNSSRMCQCQQLLTKYPQHAQWWHQVWQLYHIQHELMSYCTFLAH